MRLTALAKLWRNNSLVNLLGKDFFLWLYQVSFILSYAGFQMTIFCVVQQLICGSIKLTNLFDFLCFTGSVQCFNVFFIFLFNFLNQEKVVSVHCIFLLSDAHIILYLCQRFLFVFSFFYPPASLAYLFISVVSAKHRTVFPSPLFHLLVCYFALLFASLKGKAQASYIGYLYCFHEIFFWVSIPTRSFLTVNMQLVINGRARTSLLVISFSCIKRNGRGTL